MTKKYDDDSYMEEMSNMKKSIRHSSIVRELLSEAGKKKKKKADLGEKVVLPKEFMYSPSFDFSTPQGVYNLYRRQGQVNWGPATAAGTHLDGRLFGAPGIDEASLLALKEESLSYDNSVWRSLYESTSIPKNVWESALRWYDNEGLGLGSQTQEGIENKKISLAKKKKALGRKK